MPHMNRQLQFWFAFSFQTVTIEVEIREVESMKKFILFAAAAVGICFAAFGLKKLWKNKKIIIKL